LATVERLVETVHAAGARIAAHSTTRHVTGLISAAVDSVEHGPALDESDLDNLGAGQGAWTPTLCAMVGKPSSGPERQRQQREIATGSPFCCPPQSPAASPS
jgi:hypothetical protein